MTKPKGRQAGAQIKITPTMVRVGVAALLDFDSDDLQDDAEYVVATILNSSLAVQARQRASQA